jgi:hypothetical protein
MAEIEPLVEPDRVADDIWRELVVFTGIPVPILPISAS